MNDFDDRIDLAALNPGSHDPGFWIRYHRRVMSEAGEELMRRRVAVRLSVPDVVFQWRKTLVPLTLLAAALGGLLLTGEEEPTREMAPVALEEALVEGLAGDPIPTVLQQTADLDEVAFLARPAGFRP